MRTYLRSRRAPALAAVALLTGAGAGLDAGQVAAPAVIGYGGTVLPVGALLPAALACVLAWALRARTSHLAEGAVRPTGRLDAALAAAAVALVVLGSLLVLSPDSTLLRTTALTVGLAAAGTALASPPAGALLVSGVLLVSLTYGRSAPGARFVRLLQAPPDQPWAWLVAGAALAAGTAALALVRPRVPLHGDDDG